MCLAFPAKVLRVQGEKALVDQFGEGKEVSLIALERKPKEGEYLLIQGGMPVSIIGEREAKESLRAWEELGRALEAKDKG